MAHPPLPRDLDLTPLLKHVRAHNTDAVPAAADGSAPAFPSLTLRYFPVPVLVFVTEVVGSHAVKRVDAAREAAEMLKFRATQLHIPLEHLLKPAASTWNPASVPTVPQPADADYTTHRGFIEVLAFWMNKYVISQGLSVTPGASAKEDPFIRLKTYSRAQAAIGEILFGVVMPAPGGAAGATATAVATSPAAAASTAAAPAIAAASAVAAGIPSAALIPPPPAGEPVRASLPPGGVQTIQEEIEASAATPPAAAAAAPADASGDVAMKTEPDATAAAAAAPSSAVGSFSIPSEGIPVYATRYDGARDKPALKGKLVSIVSDLTLSSTLPLVRHPAQSRATLKAAFRSSDTIEEYFAERGVISDANPALRDIASPQRIRIARVQLDDSGLAFLYPADKLWRQVGAPPSAKQPQALPASAPLARDHFFPAAAPSIPAVPALSPLAAMWQAVAADPWHLASWQRLLAAVHATHDLHTIRHAYHSFLRVFPTSAVHWKALVELELAHQCYPEIEAIFQKVLLKLPEIELWKLYLVYIKVSHAPPPGQQDDPELLRLQNVAIETAYEFCLKHMGLDLFSGPLWKSYINFLRGIPARNQQEEQSKQNSLRKIFQRAIAVPFQPKELEALWNDYEHYEHSISAGLTNKMFSQKLLADFRVKFEATLVVSRDRRKKFQGIQTASIGGSYGSKGMGGGQAHVACRPGSSQVSQIMDALQANYWARFIRFEQHQSPHLQKTDSATFRARVILAYRQALMYLRHLPHVWLDFLKFHVDTHSTAEEIRALWKDFREALPYSILPVALSADAEEEAKHLPEAKALLESLLVPKIAAGEPIPEEYCFIIPQAVVDEIKAVRAATEAAAAATAAAAGEKKEDAAAAASSSADKTDSKDESKASAAEDESIVDIYKGELHKIHPLVFILLMRFLRRAEGSESARKLFLVARKHPQVSVHSFLFAAYSEHHINNDLKIAAALYNVGLKRFCTPEFLASGTPGAAHAYEAFQSAYMRFLEETNDHANLRLNYQRALLTGSTSEMMDKATLGSNLSKNERAQMRKAHMAAAVAKESAQSAANAASAAAGAGVPIEAEDDPAIPADDWWPHINALLPSSFKESRRGHVMEPGEGEHGGRSNWRSRAAERAERAEAAEAAASLPSRSTLALWSSYVSFERDTANELLVLQKCEASRDENLQVKFSHRLNTLIDRWRFKDLWPCSRALRQTMDKLVRPDINTLVEWARQEMIKEADATAAATSTAAAAAAAAAVGKAPSDSAAAAPSVPARKGLLYSDGSLIASLKASFVRPDTSRLRAFTAQAAGAMDRSALRSKYAALAPAPAAGSDAASASLALVPEQILNVLSVLPPGVLFQGPFVHPQLVLDMLRELPEGALPLDDANGPAAAASAAATNAAAAGGAAGGRKGKRKGRRGDEEEEEDPDAGAIPAADTPANDLYRKRQQQKHAKTGATE